MKKNLLLSLGLCLVLVGCKGGGGSSSNSSTDPGTPTICDDAMADNYGMIGECTYSGESGSPSTFSGWYTRDFLLGQPNLGDDNLTDADPETIYSFEGDFAYGTTDFSLGDYFVGVKYPKCGQAGGYSFIGIQEGYNNIDPLLIGVYVNSTTNKIDITPLGLDISCNMGSCSSTQLNGSIDFLSATCDGGIMKVDINTELAHNENFGVLTYGISIYTLISTNKIESDFTQTFGQFSGFIIDGGSGQNTFLLSQNSTLKYDFGYPSIGGATFDSPDRVTTLQYNGQSIFLGTDGAEVHSAKVFIKDMDDGSGGSTLGTLSILGDHIENPGLGDYVYIGGGSHLIFYSVLD